ncbi:MAG: heme exporter protein CcmD [Alphaproteobacteria bacterium]|nr:heme exporter protein CcmD [Alphaproteobacteria bacterium]
MTDWIAMGGYAAYVWGSYAVTALTVAGLGLLAVVKLRRAERRAAELDALRPRPRRAGARKVGEAASLDQRPPQPGASEQGASP